jgi:translation initiation factor IF-2
MSEQKVRVYELAKELNKTSQELVEILNELGVSIKSYLSTIEEDTAILVKDICSSGKEATAKPKIPPATAKTSPAKTPTPKSATPKASSSPKEAPSKPPAPSTPPKASPSVPTTKATTPKATTPLPEPKETEQLSPSASQYNLIKLSRKCQSTPSEMEIKLLKYGLVLNSSTMPIPNFIALSIMEMYGVEADQSLSPDLDEALYIPRAPVITIMGHVDHGKTTLLDTIRSTRVADKELGGITQALGAYSIQVQDKKIIFIDTPGHEAFTAMRASGSEVTDIVILVVAADDGVKEQTIEAINHAKAARVPIIVAINKIDREGANPDVVKSRLSEFNLTPEEWGGDTIMVPISAKNNTGIDELLELILLKAEMMDLRTNAKATFAGTVIESSITKSFGAEAAIIVQTGTLSLGDRITDGLQEYKIRAMYDDRDKKIKSQKALAPIKLQGLSDILRPGAILKKADKDLFSASSLLRPVEASIAENPTDLESLFQNETENKFYSVIVKADGEGTLSATDVALSKINVEGVELRIVHRGVGIITDNDVLLASVSQARIVGFNVTATTGARKEALDRKVELSNYRIIFDMIDDIKKGMEGTLEPEKVEQILGTVEVKASFKTPKATIAGCIVRSGVVQKGAKVRIIRNRNILLETSIASLKRFKEDVKEVREGYECGIGLENFNDIKIGDTLEVFHIIDKK